MAVRSTIVQILALLALVPVLPACDGGAAMQEDPEGQDGRDPCSLLPKEEVFFPVEVGAVWRFYYHSEQDPVAGVREGVQTDGTLTWTIVSASCAPEPVRFEIEETFAGTRRVQVPDGTGSAWQEQPASWRHVFSGRYAGEALQLDRYTTGLPEVRWHLPASAPDTAKTAIVARHAFGGFDHHILWLVRGEGVHTWLGGLFSQGGGWERIDALQE